MNLILYGAPLSFSRQPRPDVDVKVSCALCGVANLRSTTLSCCLWGISHSSQCEPQLALLCLFAQPLQGMQVIDFACGMHADCGICVQVVESGLPGPCSSPATPSCALAAVDLVLLRLLAGQPPRLPQRWTWGSQTPQRASSQLAGPPHPTPLARPLGRWSLASPLLDRSP